MPKAVQSKITCARLRALYDYDHINGILWRLQTWAKVTNKILKVDNELHSIARYLWLHYYEEWPPLDKLVDHKDRDSSNWKINNLRLADYHQNGYNMSRINHSGFKGIYDCGRKNKPWQAQIRIEGLKINLGRFLTKEEAALAYIKASQDYHQDFGCYEIRSF